MDTVLRIRISLLTLLGISFGGTLGYHLIEGWSLFDAFYMTVITLATVGFHEVRSMSDAGRVFTILLIVFGTGTVAYVAGNGIQLMLEGQLRRMLGRIKLEKKINKLKAHYIVCGYGRIGQLICREFMAHPVPFVVVERNPELWEKLQSENILFVRGNATDDEVLHQAGIERASGLITACTSDSENVYITLTARGLNPELFIMARSGEETSEKKLLRAGANKVISPYNIGAARMAQGILRPSVVDFIEIATAGHNLELQLEEIAVQERSCLAGHSLVDSEIRKNHGVIIVCIKKRDGRMIFNPASETAMEAGDILITLGKPQAIERLETLACGAAL